LLRPARTLRDAWQPPASRHVVVIDEAARTWRVLDAARARSQNTRAHWQPAPADDATGRAFIARDMRTGRKLVRVVDRHPADAWGDVSRAALLAQRARAYLPPVGWVERHGGTGSSRRPGA
jgi:hypothetical protein